MLRERVGCKAPLRPPHRAHLHSPVLLQPQEVFPALGTDTVEDVGWVGALHGREVPSEVPHGPRPAQEGDRVCVCPAAHPAGIQQRHGKSEEKEESTWAITQPPSTS